MPLIDILLSLLIIAAIFLIVYLITWLHKIGKVIEQINNDIGDLHDKAIPLIENLTKTAESTSKITNEAEKYFKDFSEIVDILFDKLSWFKSKSGSMLQKTNSPGEGIFLNLRAISKGIRAFIKNL